MQSASHSVGDEAQQKSETNQACGNGIFVPRALITIALSIETVVRCLQQRTQVDNIGYCDVGPNALWYFYQALTRRGRYERKF